MTAPAILLLAATLALGAQSPEFEVATLKPSPPLTADLYNINLGTVRNGKLTLTNANLNDCLKFAYSILSDAQISGPDWIRSKQVRFDVVGQAPPDTPRDQLLQMLQRLLADRLQLQIHHEQKELPFLALTVARNGPKLQPAAPDAPPPAGPMVLGRIVSDHMSMSALAGLLSRFERQTILDKTALPGFFQVHLEWTRDSPRPLPPLGDAGGSRESSDTSAAPSIYAALQEQLGLKLESRKGPLDVLVVDHAEPVPAAN